MKSLRCIATFLFFTIPVFSQQDSISRTMGEQTFLSQLGAEFDSIANEWMDAYNSKDGERIAALYTEDADYVSPHVPGLILHGRENIRANFQRGMDEGGHIDSIKTLATGYSCDMAYVVCRYDATNNGQQVNGRNLIVLKNVEGKWLFHSHASVVRD